MFYTILFGYNIVVQQTHFCFEAQQQCYKEVVVYYIMLSGAIKIFEI